MQSFSQTRIPSLFPIHGSGFSGFLKTRTRTQKNTRKTEPGGNTKNNPGFGFRTQKMISYMPIFSTSTKKIGKISQWIDRSINGVAVERALNKQNLWEYVKSSMSYAWSPQIRSRVKKQILVHAALSCISPLWDSSGRKLGPGSGPWGMGVTTLSHRV